MNPPSATFWLDAQAIPFTPGQTVLQAALAAGASLPHLCFHPEFAPHGSCRVCVVRVGKQITAACTLPAEADMPVESAIPEIQALRQTVVQMLFAEGNHFCPSCEKSGACELQNLARELGVLTAGFRHFFPDRPVDASHPDVWLDSNRCILCELCVRASAEVDKKSVFAIAGRGLGKHLAINSASGRLGDSALQVTDRAAHICPVGALLPKRIGFVTPIGARPFDHPEDAR